MTNPDDVPAELEGAPENFVSYTLRHQEVLPPVTWKNWYRELHWFHVIILVAPPTLYIVGRCYTPLPQGKTYIWGVVYGHLTGLGTYITVIAECWC